ncbi:hypothetical protein BC831DRAFT_412011 [Entophlyctis helioformis]|nr:hypothetical protein BC831DRAFT_412011 [Entophlyctis helioformis]
MMQQKPASAPAARTPAPAQRPAPPPGATAATAAAKVDAATLESVRQDYRASLADLTFNSKPIITSLTIIAQENIACASVIAQVIADQIRLAPPKQKIPVMYLMDSILKNIGGVYKDYFAKTLVATFTTAYASVDSSDKQRMQKLAGTWKSYPSGPLFSPGVFAQIERLFSSAPSGNGAAAAPPPKMATVSAANRPPPSRPVPSRQITPPSSKYPSPTGVPASLSSLSALPSLSSMPIQSLAQLSGQLPSFAAPIAPAAPVAPAAPAIQAPPLAVGPNGPATLLIQQQISMLLQQKRSLALLSPNDAANVQQINVLEQLLNVIMTTLLDPATIGQINMQIQAMVAASAPPAAVMPQTSLAGAPMSTAQPPAPAMLPGLSAAPMLPFPASTMPTPGLAQAGLPQPPQMPQIPLANAAALSQFVASSGLQGISPATLAHLTRTDFTRAQTPPVVDISRLAGAMQARTGAPTLVHITMQQPNPVPHSASGTGSPQPPASALPKPVFRISQEDLVSPNPAAISNLYDAMPLQCKQCGIRFAVFPDGKERMSAHLDWHFRQNRRIKDTKKTISRNWYVSESEWIEERDAAITDKQATAFFGEAEQAEKKPEDNAVPVSNIPAQGAKSSKCAICCEPFDKYYDEDMDEWMLRGAVCHDDEFYHQACWDDSPQGGAAGGGAKRKLEDGVDGGDKKARLTPTVMMS